METGEARSMMKKPADSVLDYDGSVASKERSCDGESGSSVENIPIEPQKGTGRFRDFISRVTKAKANGLRK